MEPQTEKREGNKPCPTYFIADCLTWLVPNPIRKPSLECLRVTSGGEKTSRVRTNSGALLRETSLRSELTQRKSVRKRLKEKQTLWPYRTQPNSMGKAACGGEVRNDAAVHDVKSVLEVTRYS